MVQAIRQISEVVIQVLSMLLHYSLQIIEAAPTDEEMLTQELTNQFQVMLSEMQNQRAMLESLMEQMPLKRTAEP